ncbi:hypothetical protein RDABS01_016122 [Bienertia sinuspersici]
MQRVRVSSKYSPIFKLGDSHLSLSSKYTIEGFFTQRKELGLYDPWLFVLTFHKCTGKIQWLVLDLTHFTWHTIPEMPCRDKVCPQGFRCVSVPNEGILFVCGGMLSDVDCPLDAVLKCETHKNRWTGCWHPIASMGTNMASYDAAVLDGKLLVTEG